MRTSRNWDWTDWGQASSGAVSYPYKQHAPGEPSNWNGWAYVMNGNIDVYPVYYYKGSLDTRFTWSRRNILEGVLGGLKDTYYFETVKAYYYNCGYTGWRSSCNKSNGQSINSLEYKWSAAFDCSWYHGGCGTIGSGDVEKVLDVVLWDWNALGRSDNAIYLFIADQDITIQAQNAQNNNVESLGNQWCSYHSTWETRNHQWFKYAAAKLYLEGATCMQNSVGVNDRAVDNLILLLAHELVDTILTPNPASLYVNPGWHSVNWINGKEVKVEVADKCVGSVPTLMSHGGKDWNAWSNGYRVLLPGVWNPERGCVSPRCRYDGAGCFN